MDFLRSDENSLVEQMILCHDQIKKLDRIVATQCKLTGVNPLSQEMEAWAFFAKTGKRPKNLLNPEAVDFVKSVFSLKDSMGERENRKICSQFNVTATQEKELLFSCDNPDNNRKSDNPQPLKMLTSPGDVSDKRRDTRERRKVQLLEHPSQSSAQRTPKVSKSTNFVQARPLSADDVLKAKARFRSIQRKNGKNITCFDDQVRPENQKRSNHSRDIVHQSGSESHAQPETETGKQRRLGDFLEVKIQTPWRTPQEIKINDEWLVACRAESKELKVQNTRIHRERKRTYETIEESPSNPSEPHDREMDRDEKFTPKIPIEEFPEPLETPSMCVDVNKGEDVTVIASTSSECVLKPDPELLAALLKNQDLVFALTSGQSGGILSDETVKLLDMIKENGNGPNVEFSINPSPLHHTTSRGNAHHPQILATTTLTPQPLATVRAEARMVVPRAEPPQHLAPEMKLNTNSLITFNRSAINNARPPTIQAGPRVMPPDRFPSPPQFTYLKEPVVSNPLIARQSYAHGQYNSALNNYNAHTRRPVQAHIRADPMVRRSNTPEERLEFVSRPNDCPSRAYPTVRSNKPSKKPNIVQGK